MVKNPHSPSPNISLKRFNLDLCQLYIGRDIDTNIVVINIDVDVDVYSILFISKVKIYIKNLRRFEI